jgi:hypothetical protein
MSLNRTLRSKAFQAFTIQLTLLAFTNQLFAASLLLDSSAGKRGQAEYFNSNEDQRLTMKVQLVGGVTSPGVYHLPDNVTLIEALTLAGGTVSTADLGKVHVRRLESGETKTFTYNLADVMSDSKSELPKLKNHDLVLIETKDTSAQSNLVLISTIFGIITSGLLIYVTTNNLTKSK